MNFSEIKRFTWIKATTSDTANQSSFTQVKGLIAIYPSWVSKGVVFCCWFFFLLLLKRNFNLTAWQSSTILKCSGLEAIFFLRSNHCLLLISRTVEGISHLLLNTTDTFLEKGSETRSGQGNLHFWQLFCFYISHTDSRKLEKGKLSTTFMAHG